MDEHKFFLKAQWMVEDCRTGSG